MWTEHEEQEYRRLRQKRNRARDTGTRDAMLRWNKTKGKLAKKRYEASAHGKKVLSERRKKEWYREQRNEERRTTING